MIIYAKLNVLNNRLLTQKKHDNASHRETYYLEITMTNLTTHTSNTNKYYLDLGQENVSKLVSIADKAIDDNGNWQSFTIKNPQGKEKKFQVKFTNNIENGQREVSIRRNSLASKLSRSSIFKRFFADKSTKETLKYAQAKNILERYAFSRHSIRTDSAGTNAVKPAHQHRLTPTQLEKSAQPFKTSSGISHILSPSKVIDQVRSETSDEDNVAIFLGLEGTLCSSEAFDSTAPEHAFLLDSKMPAAIKQLKNERPNIRLIVSTQTPHSQKEKVLRLLQECKFDPNDFDIIHCDGDPELEYQRPEIHGQINPAPTPAFGKSEGLQSSLKKLAKDQGVPQKVIMIDNSKSDLKEAAESCKNREEADVVCQLYQTHLEQHLTYLEGSSESGSNNRSGDDAGYRVSKLIEADSDNESTPDMTEQDSRSESISISPNTDITEQDSRSDSPNTDITEKDLLERASFRTQHYYLMLRG